MTWRRLQPSEWPRLRETGCRVDQRWLAQDPHGHILVVEECERIIATAFVFITAEMQPIIDGVWIADEYRHKLRALRPLYRGMTWALKALLSPLSPSAVLRGDA